MDSQGPDHLVRRLIYSSLRKSFFLQQASSQGSSCLTRYLPREGPSGWRRLSQGPIEIRGRRLHRGTVCGRRRTLALLVRGVVRAFSPSASLGEEGRPRLRESDSPCHRRIRFRAKRLKRLEERLQACVTENAAFHGGKLHSMLSQDKISRRLRDLLPWTG